MRKTVAITLMLLVAGIQTAGAITASGIRWGEDLSSNQASNTLKQWTISIENRLGGAATAGTGNTYYVDSNVTLEGDGSSWTKARNTLQEAVDLCTASNGDVIYVAQGTAETIASAGALALDCAGITIIGCGKGDQRPTYTVSTASTATITVTADDVYVYNMIIQSGKSDLATSIIVTADDFTLDHCALRDSTAGLGMITIGAADGDSDRFCIANSYFYQPGTTTDHSIEVLFDMAGGIIANNTFYGDYDEGAIALPAGADACLDLIIANNVVYNKQTSGKGISITNETSTGVVAGNSVYVDTYANGIDPGGLMDGGGNFLSTAVNLAGISALPAPAIGTVTAGSAEDILKKLMYTADGTGNYPASVAQESALSYIMGKGASAAASSYVNTTDSLEAIADHIQGLLTTAGGTGDYPTGITDNTILAYIMGKGATASASTFVNTTDSLEMLSDKLGAFAGTAGAGAGESLKADMVLEQTDLDAILADTITVSGGTLPVSPTAGSLSTFISGPAGSSALGTALGTDKSIIDAIGSNGVALADTAVGVAGIIGIPTDADNAVVSTTIVENEDGSLYERLEYVQKLLETQFGYKNAVAGSAHPIAFWYVDPAAIGTGDGKSPANAFTTIDLAIAACSNTVEDFVLVFDYSGSAATITINKSWVHLLGNVGSMHPYPRINATTGHGITLSDGFGRIEIAGFTIGGQSTKAGIGLDTGAASQVYVHDCHFGIDSSSLCQEGIYVANGADAVDLVVENCDFKTAVTQEGIEIAGNATWARIRDNLFIGCTASNAYPAISLSGSVVGIAVERNRIGGGTDDAAGWGISIGAGSSDCWVNNNYVNDGKAAVGFNPFEDGATNAWGLNYAGIVATLP